MHTQQSVADPVHADDIALFDMANLSPEKTGVDGIIDISTAQGSHAPRVKWYSARPAAQAPCLSVTIEASPQAFNHHLPTRVFDAASARVIAWVALNATALLDFWHQGATWLDDEATAFKRDLKTLPPRT
jgi:hypothetical protein